MEGGNGRSYNEKQVEEFLNSVKWYPQGGEGKPVYALVPSLAAVTSMNSKFGLCYNIVGVHFRHGHMSWFFDEAHLRYMSKILLRRFLKNNYYFIRIYDNWKRDMNALLKIITYINDLDFSGLRDKELLKLFDKLYKLLLCGWDHLLFIDSFDPYGDEYLRLHLKKYSISVEPNELKVLYTNTKKSFSTSQRLELLEILAFVLKHKKEFEKIDSLLKEHQKKYYWHQNNYGHIRYLTLNDFYKEINDMIKVKNLRSISKEMAEINKFPIENEKQKSKIIKRYKMPKDLVRIFNLFNDLSYYRDERKRMSLMGITAMRYVLYKISKRLNVDVGTLEYMTPWEVKDVFKLTRKQLLEIRDRKEDSLWIFRRQNETLFFKLDDARRWKDLINNLIILEHKDLKGLGASDGKSKGIVKIISLVKEFEKMQEGDILVTQMTRPEFTPLMKKASAIITDEGGITCHAAIMSRELGIPCVIGTKVATKILKDGMEVEVDGTNGYVKIKESTIKNVIFDISGVFLSTDEGPTLKHYSKKLNLPIEKVECAHNKLKESYESGKVENDEFLKSFFKELRKKADKDYWKIKLGFKERINEMFDLLKILKERYKVFFITNEGREYWNSVEKKFNINGYFDGGIASNEVGYRKPDARIFQALINKHVLNPKECVFIDDKEENLAGAKESGMMVLHFKGIGQLREDLVKIGIILGRTVK